MVSLVFRPCARGQALLQGRAEGRLEFISGDAEQVLLVRAPVGPGACRRVNSLWCVALCDPCLWRGRSLSKEKQELSESWGEA